MRARGLTPLLAMALVATACGRGSDKTAKQAGPTTTMQTADKGGTLVISISQEPTCADWLAACGSALLGFTSMANHTMPRAFDFVDGQNRPSPLLTGEPALEAGPPQRVTYRINPKAVWSDGHPMRMSRSSTSASRGTR